MEVEITLGVLGAIIIGLVQVGKAMGLPSKYAPLLSVAFGVVGLIGLAIFGVTTRIILIGVVVGLAAAGLYDNLAKGKEIIQTIRGK